MLRKILGVVLGYVVMFIAMFILFTAAYLAMGAEAAFVPNSYDISMLWLVLALVVSFVAAVAGGYAAALIGGSSGTARFLAVVILLIGLLMTLMVAMSPKFTEPRTGNVPNMEAMAKAQQPLWAMMLNAVAGAGGAFVGGSLRKRKD